MRPQLSALVTLLILGTQSVHCADENQFLYADMSLTMFCDYPKGRTQNPQFASAIESFLYSEGFKVLNYGRLPKNQFDMRIVGLNAKRQIVEFSNPRGWGGRYGVLLWIEPLTDRATELEEKLQRFAETNLKCEIQSESVKQAQMPNDHRSKKLFNHKMNEIQELLKQLDMADINRKV